MEKTNDEITVRDYLSRGIVADRDEFALAELCQRFILDESRRSLKKALTLARRFSARTQNQKDPLRVAAMRCLARVSHMSGRHAEALGAYLEARRLLKDDPLTTARIDRALIDVYMYLGDFKKSRQSARLALKAFDKLGAKADKAQTEVNFANLLHRQDRHVEAERLYRSAAEYFEKENNELAVARCQYNRANTLVQLFELESAENLYYSAEKIYKKAGYTLDACDARYGLAWLWMLTGKFHRAFLELADCEKIYKESGDLRGEALCILDRAEVNLGLGLYRDAYLTAIAAEKKFARLGLTYELAKAALFRGQAAAALGRTREAGLSAERSRRIFEKEKNYGFMGVVHLLNADLGVFGDTSAENSLKNARRYFTRAQLPLWEAVCYLREAADRRRSDRALEKLSENRAARHVPFLYTCWQTALGDRAFRRGQIMQARNFWRKAADCLDFVKAQLPPPELRSAYGGRHSSPHLKLIAAELNHDPAAAAVWSERYRTAGVWMPFIRTAVNDKRRKQLHDRLDILAGRVGALARQIGQPDHQRGLTGSVRKQTMNRLQRQIRDDLLTLESNPEASVTSHEYLKSQIERISRRLPLVQFHLQGNDITAFVHYRGDTRLKHIRGGRTRLTQALGRWQFIMEGEMLSGYLGRTPKGDSESLLWAELGEWLWKPLEIDKSLKNVLIIPEGELTHLAWPAVTIDNEALLHRHNIIISPSIRHFLAARSHKADSDRVEIFKGATQHLTQTGKEIDCLTALAGNEVIIHDPCRRADWPVDENAALWHYTGHAEFVTENPFYSYLLLDDGPLFAADFRLKNCLVDLVILAACRSGEHMALPGTEATGLVRSLIEMGARNVVAANWPIADEAAALWACAFYEDYFKSYDILDSFRHASDKTREKYNSAYYWASFSLFGAGDKGDRK
jgi:tetratricopeptide (TPR) repeat protein